MPSNPPLRLELRDLKQLKKHLQYHLNIALMVGIVVIASLTVDFPTNVTNLIHGQAGSAQYDSFDDHSVYR